MNILLVTNNLYATGGDWTYVKQVYDLYRSYGHKVYFFGLKNDENLDKNYQDYYVSYVDLHEAKKNKLRHALKVFSQSLYSKEAAKKIAIFIEKFNIEIVQLNSIHLGVTPSVIRAIHRKGVPIVCRIIDYSQICKNVNMVCKSKVCDKCLNNKHINVVLNNCKQSILTSIFVAVEAYFYTLRGDYKLIDMYSFQNNYMRKLFIKGGVDENKTIVINNPYDCSKTTPNFAPGKTILFVGRLEPEKGILTFLKSAKLNQNLQHVVVGDGSLREEVRNISSKLDNVSFMGPVWGEDLDEIIKMSRFVVCPSEWQEPSSYVAFQSFACGKPVIAANMGGLPEVITNDVNGLLFSAGNVVELTNKINNLYYDTEKIVRMGKAGRQSVETLFLPEKYYTDSINLFNKLLNKQ
jgi:glycosyltransferase involved in cell wall biosynthesis